MVVDQLKDDYSSRGSSSFQRGQTKEIIHAWQNDFSRPNKILTPVYTMRVPWPFPRESF